MTLYFFREFDENGFMSNFSEHPLTMKGKVWRTSEHYYQAQKHVGTPLEEQVRLTEDTLAAKILASDPKTKLRPDWEEVKVDVMREAVYAKFSQNADARALLLATGDEELAEKSDDGFWGTGRDGKGQSWLGRVLMEVRAKLREPG